MHLPSILFVSGLLALAATPAFARDKASHGHGSHAPSRESGKSGAGASTDNPPAASLGGAISGREEAGKGGNSQKGNTAEGLRPR